MPLAPSAYATRFLDLSRDGETLCPMWSNNLGLSPSAARDKLATGYLANPAGIGEAIALEASTGSSPVGAQCLHLRHFSFGGQRLTGACLSDFVVDAAHRSAGPAVMLMRAAVARAGELATLVYGFPNAKAGAVCSRAGLRRAGELQRLGKLLRLRALWRDAAPPAWARLVAPLVDGALSVTDALLQRFFGLGAARCVEAALDDPRLDALWQQRSAALCLSERSRAVLAWRYGYAEGDWQLLMVTRQDGPPWGYAVVQRRGDIGLVSDVFCADPQRHTAGLLLALARHLRSQGAAALSVELLAPDAVARQVRRALFAPHGQGQLVYVLAEALPDEARQALYLTSFDRDM